MFKKLKTRFALQLDCIIHYERFDFYINVKEISINNEQRIREAKLVRGQLGGANFHQKQKQWKGIPDTTDANHGKPMTPLVTRN